MTHSQDRNDGENEREFIPPRDGDLRNLWIVTPNDSRSRILEWESQSESRSEPDWVEPGTTAERGRESPWHHPGAPERDTSLDDAYETCPTCGAVPEQGDAFCPSCGASLLGRERVETFFARQTERPAHIGTPAGIRRRLLAFVIDSVIVGVVMALLFPVMLGRPFIDIDGLNAYAEYVGELMDLETSAPGGELPPPPDRASDAISNLQFSSLINSILFCVYQAISIGILGTSAGKRLLGIYVVDKNGEVMGIPRSAARAVPMLASLLFFYFGFIFALFRSDRRALHDLVADTYPVINWTHPESV